MSSKERVWWMDKWKCRWMMEKGNLEYFQGFFGSPRLSHKWENMFYDPKTQYDNDRILKL